MLTNLQKKLIIKKIIEIGGKLKNVEDIKMLNNIANKILKKKRLEGKITNENTSFLDLDSLYGEYNEYLNNDGFFDVNTDGDLDLKRDKTGKAIISDTRKR